MARPEKVEKVKELDEIFSKSQGIYLADFTNMSVELAEKLRSEFREKNVNYKVIKNTLDKRAVEDKAYKDLSKYFQGPTAIAYSYDDPVTPSRILVDFAKENDTPQLKASVIEGKILDLDQTKEMAKIPSKEVLISRIVGGIKSPLSGLVFSLNGIVRNLVYVIHAIKEEKSKNENKNKGEEK